MTEPAPYTEDDVALVAAATELHYIVAGRTDAMGNSPCVCDQWWDAAGDNPGWDQHMAEVTLAALANAGRLRNGLGVSEVMAYELGREDARRQIAEALRKRAEAFGSYDARDALLEFAEDIHDRRVGPWVPVSEPDLDMSTAPNPSVGAHNEAHSAHTPAVPEGAEPPCGLPPGLCGDDEDCRLPPCQPASVVPGEEQA